MKVWKRIQSCVEIVQKVLLKKRFGIFLVIRPIINSCFQTGGGGWGDGQDLALNNQIKLMCFLDDFPFLSVAYFNLELLLLNRLDGDTRGVPRHDQGAPIGLPGAQNVNVHFFFSHKLQTESYTCLIVNSCTVFRIKTPTKIDCHPFGRCFIIKKLSF